MKTQAVGIPCSPLTTAAYALYLALGIVFLLLPWLVWMELVKGVKGCFHKASGLFG